MKLLLKNGTVIDYASKTNEVLDVLVENDKIVKVAKEITDNADKVIDCKVLYIMPGMIDMHCHLREPGGEHKETIETGSRSAVKGGFTSICPMPNTKPTPDSAIVLEQILQRAKEVNLCNIFPFSSVTKGEKGEKLVDFKSQLEAGAIAFSDDGMPVENAKMIRSAKERGVNVTCENCPHYFSFTVDEVLTSGVNANMYKNKRDTYKNSNYQKSWKKDTCPFYSRVSKITRVRNKITKRLVCKVLILYLKKLTS